MVREISESLNRSSSIKPFRVRVCSPAPDIDVDLSTFLVIEIDCQEEKEEVFTPGCNVNVARPTEGNSAGCCDRLHSRCELGEECNSYDQLEKVGQGTRPDEAVPKTQVEIDISQARTDEAVLKTPSSSSSSLTTSGSRRLSGKKRFQFHPWVLMWSEADEGNLKELERLLRERVDIANSSDQDEQISAEKITIDYDRSNNEGCTILHLCCFIGSDALECIRLLIKLGANPEAKTNNGWTPRHIAKACGHQDLARFLKQFASPETLPRRYVPSDSC